MLRVYATDLSNGYLKFLEHQTQNLSQVFIRRLAFNVSHQLKRPEKLTVKEL